MFQPGFRQPSDVTRISGIVFTAIALYNSLELFILILRTFKRYRSLYFWAILLSNIVGMIPMTIGDILESFDLAPDWLMLTLECVGWTFLVPGQSVVLYSRMHLVCHNQEVILFIRNLIIVTTILLVPPVIITDFGTVYTTAMSWTTAFKIIDRLQLTWFSVQECAISSVYIIETIKIIRVYPKNKQRTKIFFELLTVNAICILMDITLVVLQYLDFYFMQILVKSFVYSIKLKLEFAVLGTLVSTTHLHVTPEPISSGEEEGIRSFRGNWVIAGKHGFQSMHRQQSPRVQAHALQQLPRS